MADVQGAREILTHPSLQHAVALIPTRNPRQQLQMWKDQKSLHDRTTTLITSLGKPAITKPQAKKLDRLALTYKKLVDIYNEAEDEEIFFCTLKVKGVNSKPLRAKLWKLLTRRTAV